MERLERSIEVEAPVSNVYNQWTQFEEFPRFMEGVESVKQITDSKLHWVTAVAGKRKEWDADITEQVPDQVIAWEGFGDPGNLGRVFFEPADGGSRTRVKVAIDYETKGAAEKVGDAVGLLDRRVQGDLKRFKDFIESRGGAETGGWRGEIHEEPRGAGTS
jgi:uncharacterized membrane protein